MIHVGTTRYQQHYGVGSEREYKERCRDDRTITYYFNLGLKTWAETRDALHWIADECRRIRSQRGPVPPGQAVATTAGRLPAKYVIHAVGPIWQGGDRGEAEVLSSCYRESIRIAEELKLTSIAFPAISTGIFGYPLEEAARVAIPSIVESLRSAGRLVLVAMVLFDKTTLDVFAKAAMAHPQPTSGHPYEVSIKHYA